MSWLNDFIAALQQTPRHPNVDAMSFTLPKESVLVEFHRLHLPLQLLYALWTVISLLFLIAGINIVGRIEGPTELSNYFVPTILIIVGAGLLFECTIGIRLDVRK